VPIDEVLILAAGIWPEQPPAELVARAGLILATDGAWARAAERGVRVDRVVGDLDSLTADEVRSLRRSQTPIDVFPQDKDQTDLEIAIDQALLLRPARIAVWGALGGRTDHLLANVFLLERIARSGVRGEVVNGDERLIVTVGRTDLREACLGDGVSLLALTDRARGVTTWGLRYALDRATLERASSRGVSNEVVALPAAVSVEDGALIVVHRRAQASGRDSAR